MRSGRRRGERNVRVAIIGSGFIGQGWAIVHARAGHDVAIYDVSSANMARCAANMAASLDLLQRHGLLSQLPRDVAARVTFHEALEEALAGAEFVQENIAERVDVKREIFASLDRLSGRDAILASSSSSISCSEFCADLPTRSRCLIAHPANPPFLMPAVEVVPAPFTSGETVSRTMAVLRGIGQEPVLIEQEIEGFVMNRLQAALANEALHLVEDKVASAQDIDAIVRSSLGLRWSFMGPFETMDLNAPDGFADFANRYGAAFGRISRLDGWPANAVAAVDRERRADLPKEAMDARRGWRDERLAALLAHQAAAATGDPDRP